METIAEQLGDDRPGAKVYDFSNTRRPRRGGHDPAVPQIMIPLAVRGKLLVGHTADLRDESAPILIDQGATVHPGGGTADLRCRQCVARVDVGQLDGATLAVLGHEPGCEWLAGALAAAGLAS